MKQTAIALSKCLDHLEVATDAKKATVYLSDKLVVSLCRRFKFSKRDTCADYVTKVGAPNYLERDFIKLCKKAGQPLPLHRVQLKYWPKPRKAK